MRKKLFGVALLTACLPVLFSCQAQYAQDFDVSIANTSTFLIDTTTRSCTLQLTDPGHAQSDDVTAMFLNLGSFKIKWTGKNAMTIAYIQISFTDGSISGGPITIGGTELGYLWSGTPAVAPMPTGELSSSPNCNFSVGGLTPPDKKKSSYGQGTFLVYGTTTDDNGAPVPVSASATFSVQYTAPGGN